MKNSLLGVWLVIGTAAVAAYVAFTGWRVFRERNEAEDQRAQAIRSAASESRMVLDARPQFVRPIEEYHLIEQSGANFRSQRLQGHVWVGNIFFSTCPKECLRLTQQMHYLQETFPQLRLVSVTCDPDNDTPQKLHGYATANKADPSRWFFVTGKLADLQRFCKEVWGEPLKRLGHTNRVVLIDHHGEWRGSYDLMHVPDLQQLEAGIETLLRKVAAPPEPE